MVRFALGLASQPLSPPPSLPLRQSALAAAMARRRARPIGARRARSSRLPQSWPPRAALQIAPARDLNGPAV